MNEVPFTETGEQEDGRDGPLMYPVGAEEGSEQSGDPRALRRLDSGQLISRITFKLLVFHTSLVKPEWCLGVI